MKRKAREEIERRAAKKARKTAGLPSPQNSARVPDGTPAKSKPRPVKGNDLFAAVFMRIFRNRKR